MNSVNSTVAQLGSAMLVTERPAVSKASSDSVEVFRAALDQPVLSARDDGLVVLTGGGRAEEGRGAGLVRISDGILRGMEKLSVGFDDSMKAVVAAAEAASSGEIRSAELLNVQLALSAVTLQYDIATKAVGKVAQTLDTFLKSQ